MTRTRIKICGLTRPGDIALCERLGADMVGLVFAPNSKRCLDVPSAQALLKPVRWAQPVGLFMNQSATEVGAIVDALPALRMLQFHGNESASFCAQFGRPYIKALGMSGDGKSHEFHQFSDAAALLLDAHAGDQAGGSGEAFDWRAIPGDIEQPVILAGGLKPANVAQAITQVKPFAVDVSSGVECAPGQKQSNQLHAFFNEVNRVNSTFCD